MNATHVWGMEEEDQTEKRGEGDVRICKGLITNGWGHAVDSQTATD
jgi:hypothetical protein